MLTFMLITEVRHKSGDRISLPSEQLPPEQHQWKFQPTPHHV